MDDPQDEQICSVCGETCDWNNGRACRDARKWICDDCYSDFVEPVPEADTEDDWRTM